MKYRIVQRGAWFYTEMREFSIRGTLGLWLNTDTEYAPDKYRTIAEANARIAQHKLNRGSMEDEAYLLLNSNVVFFKDDRNGST